MKWKTWSSSDWIQEVQFRDSRSVLAYLQSVAMSLWGMSIGCWDLACVCWRSRHPESVLSDPPVESFLLHVLESYYHFNWAVSTLCLPCLDHRLFLESGNVTSLRLRQTFPAPDPPCYIPIFLLSMSAGMIALCHWVLSPLGFYSFLPPPIQLGGGGNPCLSLLLGGRRGRESSWTEKPRIYCLWFCKVTSL